MCPTWIDPFSVAVRQVARNAGRFVKGAIDHREEHRILAETRGGEPAAILVDASEWAVSQIRPVPALDVACAGGVKVRRMAFLERFEVAVAGLR